MKTSLQRHLICLFAITAVSATALAVMPTVKVVPWVAGNPLIPHDTYDGKLITLKGTCDQQGANFEWSWDFGDGSPPAVGTVTDKYVVEARHAYTGPVGTLFTARLTIRDTNTGESASKPYYIKIEPKELPFEVNVAIDEGLWYLHKAQRRFTSGSVEVGDWAQSKYGGYANSGWPSVWAANVNAFEVNGHLESGSPDNPYTETVQRGLRRLFEYLTTSAIGMQSNPMYPGGVNPDSNGNGYGVFVNSSYPFYQGGMLMDAIIASGTPLAVAVTGPAPSGANPGILGRTYADIIQDMVDAYAWAQYDGNPGGGWRYSANQWPDNSACQWAAIGMIPAERNWGLTVPQWVKNWNVPWLAYTQAGNGAFGYTDTGTVWGPYATTPSGMVQMVMDGIGRGMTGPNGAPSWDKAETFIRDRFGNTGGAGNAIKDYYYGLLSFVKSMLLYPFDGDENPATPDPTPIKWLRSQTPGVPPLDWYAAEVSNGDPTDGVARTLVDDQSFSTQWGYWYGHNYTGDQYPFETAWAIQMLNRTIVDPGAPVAVAKAISNPGVVGQLITLDGSDSYHQSPGLIIDSWEWDVDNDGTYDASGPFVTATFAAVGNYPVRLRVTDNGTPEKSAETIVVVRITEPPVAPTADAGGPYVFCPQAKPWFLDGRWSRNPDEGRSEPGRPGDTIQEYAWDLDGDGEFDDAFGPTPDVTAWFEAAGPGSYLIQLRVTDTTATSFPSSGMGDLSSTARAEVQVKVADDPACECVHLDATTAGKVVKLTWTALPGAAAYNVYRGTIAGGPYLWLASVAGTAYDDNSGVTGTTYYYVVRPTALNGDELCQSNEVEVTPQCDPPAVSCAPTTKCSNLARYYRELTTAQNGCYGRMQLKIWVGDSATPAFKAGPFKSGDVVRISKAATASSRPGTTACVAGIITVKGDALIWAEDPAGQTSIPVVCP